MSQNPNGELPKICLLVLHLGQGGIEQFAANLANELVKKADVEIVSVYKKFRQAVPVLDKRVRVRYVFDFDIGARRKQLRYLVWLPWHYLTRSRMIGDWVRKFKGGTIITTRAAHNRIAGKYAGRGVKKIATEHNYLLGDKKYVNAVVRSCRGVDYAVFPAQEVFEFYRRKIRGAECIRIPHFLTSMPAVTAKLDSMEVVSLGRLAPEKGYDDLIDVFGRVAKECPDAVLKILGEGVEREHLERMVNERGMGKQVVIPGYIDEAGVRKQLLGSAMFVSASHRESFGLAALEAMSYGLPIVTFDSARGILDFMEDERDGIVVKGRNKTAMAAGIARLLDDDELRLRLGKNARKSALAYGAAAIMPEWWKLLEL